MTRDQIAKVVMPVVLDRRFSLTLNFMFSLLFTGLGVWGMLEAPSTLSWGVAINLWCGGIWFGYGLMSILQPRITERWRKQMQLEIDLMVEKAVSRAGQEIIKSMWSPSIVPPEEEPPRRRRLQ